MAELQHGLPGAKTIGLEYLEDLWEQSIKNIKKKSGELLETGRLTMRRGDGWVGLPEEAPFDAIHVGAAAENIPEALVSQLKEGGRMVCPVGTFNQVLMQIDKRPGGELDIKRLVDVMYVPLVRPKTP